MGLTFRVLGAVEAIGDDGTPVRLGERQRAVLAVLLVHAGETISVGRIADALWGDDQPADPSGAVQTNVSRLRRLLAANGGVDPSAKLSTAPGGYCLHLGRDDLDSVRFERLADDARDLLTRDPARSAALLEDALGLWQGPAYSDLADREFARPEAARLEELRRNACENHAEALLACGRTGEAVALLDAFVIEEPLRERARALLMRALYHAGRQTEALRVFEAYRRFLGEELGVEPSPALRELEHAILDHALEPPVDAAGGAPESRTNGDRTPDHDGDVSAAWVAPTLPIPVTTFVGRERDVDGAAALLERARLLTLVGAGGVGKTRLALHTAMAVGHRYPDGMWLCELAHVTAPRATAAAVASTLGVEAREGVPTEDRLVEFLQGRRALVVLDNCEHVLEAAALLVERLVTRTATVDVLATSQERLAVPGEHLWAVEPLALGDAPSDDGAMSPAVALFLDRASAVAPGFVLSPDDGQLVVEICRQLDGMPLAIELTAARLRARSLKEIIHGLDARFELLDRAGARVGPERHRSLRAVVEWSYGLLEPRERDLFDRLAVFVGGCDEEAARHVATDDTLLPGAVPSLLDALVDKSLVTRHATTQPRYLLLETLRAYGLERLRSAGTYDAARRRHADYYLELAAQTGAAHYGSDETEWARRVDDELANLREVHAYLLDADDVDGLLRLSAALRLYAYPRMRSEVMRWAEQAALYAAGSGHELLPAVYASAGIGAWHRGNLERAQELAELGYAAVDGHDPLLARFPLEVIGDVHLLSGRLDEARECFGRAQELAREAGDEISRISSLWNDALALAYAGNTAEAAQVASEGLEDAERLGSPSELAFGLYAAGESVAESDPDAAADYFVRALDAAQGTGAQFVVGLTSLSAATLQARHGDPYEALRAYPTLVEHWRRAGVWTQQWTTLRTLVEILTRIEHDEAASLLFGALMTAKTAAPVYGADRQRLDESARELESRMGHDEFECTILRGAELDAHAAVTLARRVVAEVLADADSMGAEG